MSSTFIVYRPSPPGDPRETLQFIYPASNLVSALANFFDAVETEETAQIHWSGD